MINWLQSALSPLTTLPWQSMVLLLLGALLLYFLWSLAGWLGALIERGRFSPTSYTAKKSWNNYIMVSKDDWPEGAQHKESDLLVRYKGAEGLKSSRGKIFLTRAGEFPKGTIGLPQLVRDDLGLEFDTVMQPCGLEMTLVRPVPVVGLWYHPDDSIRISTRTTFFVTLLTTFTGILTSWAFK